MPCVPGLNPWGALNGCVCQAPPPDLSEVPRGTALDVTAVFLSGIYQGKEFVRVAYYTKHEVSRGLQCYLCLLSLYHI